MYVYSFTANPVTQKSGTTEWVTGDADILKGLMYYIFAILKKNLYACFSSALFTKVSFKT